MQAAAAAQDTADAGGLLFRGKLNLCDLAGSEKIHKEEAMSGQHFKELIRCNCQAILKS